MEWLLISEIACIVLFPQEEDKLLAPPKEADAAKSAEPIVASVRAVLSEGLAFVTLIAHSYPSETLRGAGGQGAHY